MTSNQTSPTSRAPRAGQTGRIEHGPELDRRVFLQLLGSGLLVTVVDGVAHAQRRGARGAGNITARLHFNADGTITVGTGKVEEGQGSRAQLTQAAAEELRVGVSRIRLVMADTGLVPDDGMTAGSRTTPSTVPAVRQGAATARQLLVQLAARRWALDPAALEMQDGTITHAATQRKISYAELAQAPELADALRKPVDGDVALRQVEQWDVIGTSVARPNIRDLATGAHRYPSDIVRPGMLYGKILRPPSYGATLESVDLTVAESRADVVVVRDGQFVGVAAPSTLRAEEALAALSATARWKTVPQPSSDDLFAQLKSRAGQGRPRTNGSVDQALEAAAHALEARYEVAYVQHAPMEPRAATAEWNDGRLTVWAGIDYPQRIQGDLARALGISADKVRVIVPDMGGGFGGKHTGEAAEEAARLALVAGRPVAVHWTRTEEFTWAYFRPAALIECRGGVDREGTLTAWDFTNINAGGAAIDAPYEIPNTRIVSVGTDAPLRQGAYRCLAATANNFARESFMDELASVAGVDPLDFRLGHLANERIRRVLEVAAKHFDWATRRQRVTPELGVGLACGTEKNSMVAACVEVAIDRRGGEIAVREVCEAFECGPIQNPANLTSQVQGCILMGMGPALREAMQFRDGRILNPSFAEYRVPRFADMPRIDVHLVDNRDIPSAGGGETPIIAIAPAIANAVFAATGLRIRSMPIRLPT